MHLAAEIASQRDPEWIRDANVGWSHRYPSAREGAPDAIALLNA